MIVFTIGTSKPFDRLVAVADAVAEACDERVLAQGGSSQCRLDRAELVDFLPYDELVTVIEGARMVVTHAGVGSILLALGQGHRPIVVPRLRRFDEAVDDHQLAFGRRLHELGLVQMVEEPGDLASVIAAGVNGNPEKSNGGAGLALALRAHLSERLGPAREMVQKVA